MIIMNKLSFRTTLQQLAHLAWPIIIGFSLQTSYNIIDIFWVGKLGPLSIAAVSLAGTVFYMILAIGQIIGSGTVALVAQSYGAQQYERANLVVHQSLLLAALIALTGSILGLIFSRSIVLLLGGQGEVLIQGSQYLRIIFIGFFFQLLSFSINYAFRGAGDMKTPMLIMTVATIINIILDPLLIFGISFFPRLEVQGAAWATTIAKCASFLVGFALLLKGKAGLKFQFIQKWIFEARIIKTIFRVGIPAGISYGLMFLSATAVFRLVASFSDLALAALGIGLRIIQLASLPVVGIGIATTTMIGKHLGAKNDSQARITGITSMTVSAFVMILFTILFLLLPGSLIDIFTDDPSVILHGVAFLRIVSFYLIFGGMTITITGIFRGAGDTLPPMFAGLTKLGLLIGCAYILAFLNNMNVIGIWWAMLFSYILEGLIMVFLYFRGGWLRKGLALLDTLSKR
jgi:putative MATE family efflux protein